MVDLSGVVSTGIKRMVEHNGGPSETLVHTLAVVMKH